MRQVYGFLKIKKFRTKVSGIAYTLNGRCPWTSRNVNSQCRTSIYTSITRYPAALLQERDVIFFTNACKTRVGSPFTDIENAP